MGNGLELQCFVSLSRFLCFAVNAQFTTCSFCPKQTTTAHSITPFGIALLRLTNVVTICTNPIRLFTTCWGINGLVRAYRLLFKHFGRLHLSGLLFSANHVHRPSQPGSLAFCQILRVWPYS